MMLILTILFYLIAGSLIGAACWKSNIIPTKGRYGNRLIPVYVLFWPVFFVVLICLFLKTD